MCGFSISKYVQSFERPAVNLQRFKVDLKKPTFNLKFQVFINICHKFERPVVNSECDEAQRSGDALSPRNAGTSN